MNPLIDVALVLLIFFILTTSYDAMVKVMDMPTMTKKGGIKELKPSELNDLIVVKGHMEGDKTILEVDGQVVTEEQLKYAFSKAVSENKSKMVIDLTDVSWHTFCQIIAEGKNAGVKKFMQRVTKE